MKKLGLVAVLLGTLGLGGAPAVQEKKAVVVIDTSMGKIKAEIFVDKVPITGKNFLQYVDDAKFYDNTIFHRVIPDFMIQGGGMLSGLKEKGNRREPIKNEAGLANKRGTLAMARTNDPDSATNQFFINVVDNEGLNRSNDSAGYAVFGRVTEGMDVVDAIVKVKTGNAGGHKNVPVQDIVIRSIRRVQ